MKLTSHRVVVKKGAVGDKDCTTQVLQGAVIAWRDFVRGHTVPPNSTRFSIRVRFMVGLSVQINTRLTSYPAALASRIRSTLEGWEKTVSATKVSLAAIRSWRCTSARSIEIGRASCRE